MAYSASSAPTRVSPAPQSPDPQFESPVLPPLAEETASCDYSAHPLLDPDLFRKDRHALRYFRRLFRDSMRNDWQYSRLLNRLLHPAGEMSSLEVDERVMGSYLQDANHYVRELIDQMDEGVAEFYEPLPEVWLCQDLRELGQWIFHHDPADPDRARRIRFEAQRKLYLAKLLIQIEQTRDVQDGTRHRRYLLELLDREVWAYVTGVRDERASYAPDPDADITADSGSADEQWTFRVHNVRRAIPGSEIDVDVYHFDTRFKKESAGFDYAPGRGQYRVAERPRYERMKRNRSASILSKMLRKGLNNPNRISDMLGAKFIVRTERDVHRLAELLHHALGGMFLFRNQVDLFSRPEDHGLLNPYSAPDFRAFKEDVDILFAPGGADGSRSYLFSVELQILTLESFLKTVHSRAYSSHREYKRRQFMQGVMPYVFPAVVYRPA